MLVLQKITIHSIKSNYPKTPVYKFAKYGALSTCLVFSEVKNHSGINCTILVVNLCQTAGERYVLISSWRQVLPVGLEPAY